MALSYKIALTNVWWNRGGQDTRLFQNINERETYFSNKGLYFNDLVNFNINDNITTTIIFRDKSGRTPEEMLKCNYAIVWNTITNTYRYYFILDIKQDSNNQVMVSLDLDDITTNLVPNINNIGACKVERWTGYNYQKVANIKRYQVPTAVISYLNDGARPIQYNLASETMTIKQYGDDYVLNNWFRDNVKGWKYLFLLDNQQVVAISEKNNDYVQFTEGRCYNRLVSNNIDSLPYQSMAVPYYLTDKRIYIKYNKSGVDYYLKLTTESLTQLAKIQGYMGTQPTLYNNNPLGTYGIEEKMSNLSPLNITTYSIVDGDLVINANYNDMIANLTMIVSGFNSMYYLTEKANNNTTKANACNCIEAGYFQDGATYEVYANHHFQINGVPENGNAKILDKDFSTLRVRVANQHYDYNPLALGIDANTRIDFLYTEVLKVGISKIYLRVKTKDNCLYTAEQESDYTGLIASLDLTEPMLTNQWADYLASHKNYYMQTAFNNTIGVIKGGLATASSVMNSTNYYQAIANFSMGTIKTFMDLADKVVNQEFDKDNMVQAPDGLSNANGDPYFNMAVADIRPRLDTYQVVGSTKNAILDNWARNGVLYSRIMNFDEVINKHESYEALSVIIDKVGDNLSTKEFNRLREYMSSIHRYWHTDTFTLENPFHI